MSNLSNPYSSNPKYLPTALPVALPIATPVAGQVGELLPPLPGDDTDHDALQAHRYTNPLFGIPLDRWVRCQSTFLWAWCYQPYGENAPYGDLQLEFVNGFIGHWDNVEVAHVVGLFQAYSKGKFHRAWNRYHGPYGTIREQLYWGDELKSRIDKNNQGFGQ